MAAIANILVFISIASTSADIVSVIDLQQIAAENLLSKAVEPLPQGEGGVAVICEKTQFFLNTL